MIDKQTIGMLKTLAETMVKALVSTPEQVKVKVLEGELNLVIEVVVASVDYGHALGRDAETLKALRHVVVASAKRKQHNIKIVFDVVYAEKPTPEQQ